MKELDCIIFSDVSMWEKEWIKNSIKFLNTEIQVNVLLVEKDEPIDLSTSYIWLIARDWRTVKKTIKKIKKNKRVFLSLFDPTTLQDSSSMLFIRKFRKILLPSIIALAHSRLNYNFFKKIIGLGNNQIFLVDFPFYENDSLKVKDEADNVIKIGYLGNFLRDDNYSFLISLAHSLIDRTKRIRFYLFGEGPLKKHVLAMSSSLNLKQFFVFHELKSAFPFLDLMIYPPIKNAHFIPIFIAAQRKIPVISLSVPGIEDYIDDKNTGLIVDTDDVNVFSDLVFQLINDKEYLKTLGYNHYKKMCIRKESLLFNFKKIFLERLSQ